MRGWFSVSGSPAAFASPWRRATTVPWRLAAALASAAIAVFALAAPAAAAATPTQISADPYTAGPGAHQTEVEPDTFAFGSTVVSAFQVARVFNGGANDIGFATSTNGGKTWTTGFLPATTPNSTPAGPFFSVSDASVAYDARANVWLISYLGIVNESGPVWVMVSRSTDGGLTWGAPVGVSEPSAFLDKNWTVCDNHTTSLFFGHCYTEYDNNSKTDLEQMATSTDGGQTWVAGEAPQNHPHGLGGQPVVQPNGSIVVPFESILGRIDAFTSTDGGQSWENAVTISKIAFFTDPGGIRSSPLPTAEVDAQGRVYVAWNDCRFEAGCSANDIVMSTSTDGTTWTPVVRIPLDPVGSGVDHLIPGLGVEPSTTGRLSLTYYYFPQASCTVATCRLDVGAASSTNGGATWSASTMLAGPMQMSWLAPTSQGVMVGDYISTSFVGASSAVGVFANAFAPSSAGLLDEPMYAAVEPVTGGTVAAAGSPVLAAPSAVNAANPINRSM